MTPSRINRDFNGLNRRLRVPFEILKPLGLSLVLLVQAVRVISCDSLIFASSFGLCGFHWSLATGYSIQRGVSRLFASGSCLFDGRLALKKGKTGGLP